MAHSGAGTMPGGGFAAVWERLNRKGPKPGQPVKPRRINRRDLGFLLRNLSMLLDNGVSLPKALGTLLREKSLQKYSATLEGVRRKVEQGQSFSAALAEHPESFHELLVNQVKVAERTGTLATTLTQVTAQLEKMNELRSHIIKKMAYPVLLAVLGSGVLTFMLLYVVPVFEETYADAKIPLPMVTQALIGFGNLVANYIWFVVGGAVAGAVTIKQLRRKPEFATKMDGWLLKLPLFGPFLRDLAVLQLMDVLGNLMDAGYLLAEALGGCANSVGNRAVRGAVHSLQAAIHRGEKFSRELERHGELFPPVVAQLVIIGEQTGSLPKATSHIREHLRREIEKGTNVLVGMLEPILTISLAAAITVILLAIYLPMFDMIGTVAK